MPRRSGTRGYERAEKDIVVKEQTAAVPARRALAGLAQARAEAHTRRLPRRALIGTTRAPSTLSVASTALARRPHQHPPRPRRHQQMLPRRRPSIPRTAPDSPAPPSPSAIRASSRFDNREPDNADRERAVFVPAMHRRSRPPEVGGNLLPAVKDPAVVEGRVAWTGVLAHVHSRVRSWHGLRAEATAAATAQSTSWTRRRGTKAWRGSGTPRSPRRGDASFWPAGAGGDGLRDVGAAEPGREGRRVPVDCSPRRKDCPTSGEPRPRRPDVGRTDQSPLTACRDALTVARRAPVPLSLPLRGVIRGDYAAFSPVAHDAHSSENATKSRDLEW
jgi:hypothetical protein